MDDFLRIAFTRLRTSSHRLKIETGRWSRVPREMRVCQCGEGVQTEEHVLVGCNLTKGIQERYGESNVCFKTFMNDNFILLARLFNNCNFNLWAMYFYI